MSSHTFEPGAGYEQLSEHLAEHFSHMAQLWNDALNAAAAQGEGFDGAWLDAGGEQLYFRDDHGPRFKPNPYFAQWVEPEFITPDSKLLVRPGRKPILFLLQASDYWHAAAPAPTHLQGLMEIRTFESVESLMDDCARQRRAHAKYACVGESSAGNEALGELNPRSLLDHLDFHRARKNSYELAAMRIASEVGARGHEAAREAFSAGGTEFDIHMAFLRASGQTDLDLPYGNIVALNEHAAVLHYQFQERSHRAPPVSLLIDAGGSYRGFASDITRTYAADGEQEFAELIQLMQTHQDRLIDAVRPNFSFGDLHRQMHQQLGMLLAEAGIVTCSGEQAFEQGITEAFCPHGLGHLLGLQVHDLGGHMADSQGTPVPPPANYPTLRFTRQIEQDQVFTIEPGLYFISMLLDGLRSNNAPVDWTTVDRLQKFGGIRIEDNVHVLNDGVENLTRDAFARVTA